MRPGVVAVLSGLFLASGGSASPATAPRYTVVGHIPGPDGRWDYSSFDPVRRRVYIAHGAAVSALDVDSGAFTAVVAKGEGLHAAFALPGGRVLVTTNGASNTANFIDASSGVVLANVAVGQKPDAAIFDPATGLVAVMNGGSGDVSLIDASTYMVVASIAIGGSLEFAAVDGEGRAYVNIEDKNEIAVLNLKARALVARYPLKGCEAPGGLALAKEAGLLIAACQNKVAKVVRAAMGEDVATLPIGKGPDAVILDNARKLAFIPAGRDGVMSVIAVRGPSDVTLAQTVQTQTSARTGALDPQTGRLYLPAAKFSAAKPGERPAMIPGSFEILVVAPN